MAKKIFFVDDEIVIRENIRTCIDWEREGFHYCGDAPDGEYALPLIEECKPDILITDIKMPFMNGIELSTIVRKRLPDTKIVLMSGHDEFEYARQALRIGVEDYCLKPLASADIIQLLRNVSGKIDLEADQKLKMDQLSRSLSKMEQISREQLIAKLCGGLIASAEAIELASAQGFSLIARHYAVILTDIRPSAAHNPEDLDDIQKTEHLIGALFEQGAQYVTWKRSRTETVWVLKSEQQALLRCLTDQLADALNALAQEMDISLGIGGIQDRLQGVHTSFLEAEEDKHWRRIAEQHRSSLFENPDFFEHHQYLDRDGFINFLAIGSPRSAEEQIRQFAAGFASINWSTSLFGYYTLNDLTLEVIRKARKLYRTTVSPEESIETLKRMIRSVESLEEAYAYLGRLAELFWKWRADSTGKYGELIAQVKLFVQENYGKEGLSLQDAADLVNVSANHLSKVFSQETGQTFIEFLMMTRIRKAMELMQSSNAKSYEIACAVGYNDPHYFSNLFKRVTGMTIREFRKHGWQQDGLLGEGGTKGA